MALDVTPGVIQVRTRDKIRDQWTSDYALRVPDADVGPGTQPYVDASVAADALVVVDANALTIGRGGNLRTSAGDWLLATGEAEGVAPRPAVGATGFVTIDASSGGGLILAGAELRYPLGGLRYQVTATAVYVPGSQAPIAGIDTGPSTNLDPGTVLQFTSPPAGIGPNAAVFADGDGNGLTGGRNADDDQALRQLISDERANPPASGNDAEYQHKIKNTPGLSVQQAFTIPAVRGPGTTGFCFTMNPAKPGGSRVPNGAQVAQVYANVVGQEPGDDSVFGCDLVESGVAVALGVTWGVGALTWSDTTPWPPWIGGDPVRVLFTPAPTEAVFTVGTVFTSTANPQPGQTIAIYDAAAGVIRQKRILSVSTTVANRRWALTIDTTNNASDVTTVPAVGQLVQPWSPSSPSLLPPVLAYMDGLGPGEQFASLPDPGLRQRRQPPSPQFWSSTIGSRLISGIVGTPRVLGVPGVSDAETLAPAIPYNTPVGTPAALSYLLVLSDFAAFPQD